MMYAKIVLIDDNDADNLFHSLVLRRAGYLGEIETYETGAEAVAAFNRNEGRRDETLVLLDINMPGMDGFEFAQRASEFFCPRALCGDSSKAPMTLVMLTSSPAFEDVTSAQNVPVIHGFLTKPLDTVTAKRLISGELPGFSGVPGTPPVWYASDKEGCES